jgi:site-specific recombinase XerD
MKVSATLTGRPDQYGRKRIYIRIAKGDHRQFRATEMRVLPSQFKDGRVVGLPNAKAYNEKIKAITLQIEHDAVFGEQEAIADTSFQAYAQECFKVWEKSKSEGTMRQNVTELKKFLAYAGDGVKLSEINTDFLNGYLQHLYDIGNTQNTAWKTMKFVRKVVRRAYKHKRKKDYPFDLFEMPVYIDPNREYLTEEELLALTQIAESKKASPEIRFVANWFLISCYTALRFSDWENFSRKTHIVNNRLILYTTKTGEVVSMPLVEKTRQLFEAVRYQGMSYTNKHVNALLKEIDKGAGINKQISAHIARHTFGVRAASVMSIEACARLMGISIRVCKVYYKIVDPVSDREYEKLFK